MADYAGPFVVRGDMQDGPDEVYDAGIPQLLGGQLIPPRCGHGACQGRKNRSTIDMFVASSDIAACVASVVVDASIPSNPHWPVALYMTAEWSNVKALAFPPVPYIPRSRIIGPAPCPPSAVPAMAACVEARRIAVECGGFEDGVAQAAASAAYAIVAEASEA